MQGILWGTSSYSHVLWDKAMENCNNPIQARLLKAQTPQEWRLGLLHQAKNKNQLKVFAESKGNMESVVEGGNYKYHLQPHDQL